MSSVMKLLRRILVKQAVSSVSEAVQENVSTDDEEDGYGNLFGGKSVVRTMTDWLTTNIKDYLTTEFGSGFKTWLSTNITNYILNSENLASPLNGWLSTHKSTIYDYFSSVYGDKLLKFDISDTNDWPGAPVITPDGATEVLLKAKALQIVYVDPAWIAYKSLKILLDLLYDGLSAIVSELDDLIPAGTQLIFPFPSLRGILLATKDGTWSIEDFRLSNWSADQTGYKYIYLFGIVFKIPKINWAIDWIKLVFPFSITNFELTQNDDYWYSNGEWVLGSSFEPDKKYSFYDLLIDITVSSMLVAMGYALSQIGLGSLWEKTYESFSKITISKYSAWKMAKEIYTISTKAAAIEEDTGDILVKTGTDGENTILGRLASSATSLANITDVIDDILTEFDPSGTIKTKLDRILASIGIKLSLI